MTFVQLAPYLIPALFMEAVCIVGAVAYILEKNRNA